MKVENSHVLITGGSSGIGLAMAEEFIRRGAQAVTIVARRVDKLQEAQARLEALAKSVAATRRPRASGSPLPAASVSYISASLESPAAIGEALQQAESLHGPLDCLVCCAGSAVPGHIIDQDLSVFEQQMRINYIGTVATVKAALPGFVKRKKGNIVLVASALALFGMSGYTAYAPTKWALRGFGDCLRNELQGTGVTVSIGYPPDTNTPGFVEENRTKPPETVEISKQGSVFKPEQVAACFVSGIVRDKYHLPSPDLGQNFLIVGQTSLTPRLWSTLLEVLLAPLLVLVQRVLGGSWDAIVRRHRRERPYGRGEK